jgi:DNA-binding protein H-NS
MRKPRDYDAELKALNDKARQLKTRKQSQLGELVIACGADALSLEELTGALLVAASTTEAARREAWRKRGAAFFQGSGKQAGTSAGNDQSSAASNNGSTQPNTGSTGTS